MRQLYPSAARRAERPAGENEEWLDQRAVAALYADDARPTPEHRPWVLVNMVTSLDGATAIEGVSGKLGGPGDRMVFTAVRALADVIVVAAGTAVAEDYGPPILSDELITARVKRGQARLPTIAVVTNSLSIDPNARLFGDRHRPLIITSQNAPPDRLAMLGEVAQVIFAGIDTVDLAVALDKLASLGHSVALVEGGPSLNGQFVAADLFDELVLTFAPALVGGASKRLAVGVETGSKAMTLERILADGDHLFMRYVRAR